MMPRYFFNVHDGTSELDAEGVDLPNICAAQEQAIRTAGELLRDMAGKFWDGEEWSLEVTDGAEHVHFTLRFSARASF
jgi:hypothetical protein